MSSSIAKDMKTCYINEAHQNNGLSSSEGHIQQDDDLQQNDTESESIAPTCPEKVIAEKQNTASRRYSIKSEFENQQKKSNYESRKQSLNTNEEEIEEPTRKMSTDEVKSLQYTETQPYFAKLCFICFSSSHILVQAICCSLNGTPKISFRVTCSISSLVSVKSNDHSKALVLYPDSSQAAKALVMNGTVFRGHTIQVRFSTTTYVDPVNAYTCPSIRDLTEDYYGKIVHRFNSSEYAQIPWHMPSRKLHVVGFDSSKPNIRDILLQLFSNCGTVEKISILKNMAWIEMDSTESATNAVAVIHNSSLFAMPGKLLRVSYATYGNK
ncbi:uncharacterized protein [Blastocystis hominis]|uniref:RRM domain-containing protein n=1 Tax=Blastocystis hominis TaxID=12968 RepID=D8M5K8_BLAHO|nr:uncharacterized protein [Blastocystis hominis]CBK23347.2 unnamed protein product [Blastocystis hominis]|eukprot:XP_012897395.1 uncharacterized protein [Blastocystis hominis]